MSAPSAPPAAFRAFALAAAGLCLIALAPFPYGYYTALRVAVTAVAAYGAVVAWERAGAAWTVALALLAVVFNPVFPVYLDREAWAVVDVAAAALLGAAAVRSGRWTRTP